MRRALPLVLIPLLLAGHASAQDWKGMGRIEGRVTDAQGNALAGVSVRLRLPERGGDTTVKTDKKGKWALGGIVAGKWELDFELAGYAPRSITVPLPSESFRIPPIEIKLEKAAAQGPPPELREALEKGDAAFKEGRYAEARAHYQKLLEMRPDFAATLHVQIAYCYGREENYDKELEHLQKVLDMDPANTPIRTLMAQEALKGGLLERGMELLKGIDEATIQDPNVFFNIAVLLLNRQKAEEAIPYLTKAVTVDPSYVDGYFQRALAHLQLQKPEEAKADFRKVLELGPEGPQAETARRALDQLK